MPLIPQIVDAVDIPVIAAGGIGDGRGLIAALSLGADGVQMGTRFVCSNECRAHKKYKQAIIQAQDRDAVVTGRSTGHPVRNLKNKLTRQINEMENNNAKPEAIEELASNKLRDAVINGNIKNGSVMAGLISGLINEIKPVEDIINDIIVEANNVIKTNNNFFGVDTHE